MRLCRHLALPAGVLVATILAAACGGNAASQPAGGPATAAAATPTLAPSDAATLPATFTAADGRSIRHPNGWYTREDLGIVYLATSEAAASRLVGLGRLDPGEVFVQLAGYSIVPGATSDPAVHLSDNVQGLLDGLGVAGGTPSRLSSDGRDGARIGAQNDGLALLAISLRVADDMFADVIAYSAPGEMADKEALILAMVDSLVYPGD